VLAHRNEVAATGRWRRLRRLLAVAALVAAASTTATAQTGRDGTGRSEAIGAPGASVEELLVLVRRQNPELAARALETEAALAKASAAGSLDDPMLRITSDEVDRTSGNRINKMIYGVEQEFPLWGKRELQSSIARAEAAGARGRERSTASELEAKVKTAFARYYLASRSIAVENEVHGLLHAISQAAQTRYAQGIGTQADALRAEAERTRLGLELSSLRRDRSAAQARLNALLSRPAGAPLAEPTKLRALPGSDRLQVETLLDRARQTSPPVETAAAEITAAEGGRKLVDKSWYPDVTLGAAAIQRADGPPGYMASIGVRVPLQWGLRDAQAREAVARAGAARAKLDASLLEIQSGLDEGLAALKETQNVEALLSTSLRPQSDAAYRSALTTYQLGRGDLTAALEAAHRVQEVKLDLLKVAAEQQTLLAEIERLIGGDL
jgi:cobalt-zinc-cadmium efflux system outer membrane protein